MAAGRKSVGKRRGEREWIDAIRERATRQGKRQNTLLLVGIGDDCAVLRPRGREDLVVTTDLSLENVHFRRDWHPPESAGHRCLARGLSDLAAMGAHPEAAFLSLALPLDLPQRWAERFLDGLTALAERYGLPLAGGDLAQSARAGRDGAGGLVVADIVLLGSLPAGRALLRSGARPGDGIYVTGTLGGAAAELRSLRTAPSTRRGAAQAGHPHLYPEPRVAAGRRLLKRRLATAAIDVSDGLSTDLAHLCRESGLSAQIDLDQIPVDARATLREALHGGEDYELLFTAGARTAVPARLEGVAVHSIGRMKKSGSGPPIVLRSPDGKRSSLAAQGWEHFRSRPERRHAGP